jgi:hypothetical protein
MCGISDAIGSRYGDDDNDEKEHERGIVSLSFNLDFV